MYCAQGGNLETVKFLLQYKPDLTIKNKDGKTALDMAKRK
jgi:ankyrin repeat protein